MVNNSKRKKIFKWFRIFLIVGLVILTSPLYMRQKQEVTSEVTTNSISDSIVMKVRNVKYNPNTQLMQATFNLETTEGSTPDIESIMNLVYSIDVASKLNNREYKPDVKRVNDQYLVVTIPMVPEEFDFMRFSVSPKLVDNTKDNSYPPIKFYVSQKHVKMDKSLKEETMEEYQKQFVVFKQDQIDKSIEKENQAIKEENEAITVNIEKIKKLESELEYQVEDEKQKTQGTISTLNGDIETRKQSIERHKLTIESLREKRELVKEQYE
ncbi:hypothetical protein SL042_002215 [Enterococcus faecalis]|nr:hypothetical protein [Enterococcus faecalis]